MKHGLEDEKGKRCCLEGTNHERLRKGMKALIMNVKKSMHQADSRYSYHS